MEVGTARPEEIMTGGKKAAPPATAAAVDGGGDFIESGLGKGRISNGSGGGGGGGGGWLCSAGNAYTIATTAISGLELCLSVANALDRHGFKFNTFKRTIFGTSAVMEAVGFLFAVSMASERWVREGDENSSSSSSSSSEGMRGSGSPIMIIWEAPAASFGAEWLRKRNHAVMLGLGAQALAFWYCMSVHWYIWGLSGSTFAVAVAVAWLATLVIFHAYQHQRAGGKPSGEHHRALSGGAASEDRHDSSSARCCQGCAKWLARLPAVLVALLPPIVVNIAESVSIFTGKFTPAAYFLGVLDLVLVIPVVHYVLGNLSCAVCPFRKGSA